MIRITRREFLKYCSMAAGALGLSTSTLMNVDEALALDSSLGGVPTIWIAGQACTGCTMTLTNSIYYNTVAELLLGTLDLKYHDTLMAAAGDMANDAATAAMTTFSGQYVLVVEGAVSTALGGAYCNIGSPAGLANETMLYNTAELAKNAGLVICVGQCATFGGIPSAQGSETGAKGVLDALNPAKTASSPMLSDDWKLLRKKLINIPGCPPHPDWIVGTIANFLVTGKLPRMDVMKRPLSYFGKTHCFACDRYESQKTHDFASQIDGEISGESAQLANKLKCLKQLGCKGRVTKTDCPSRWWNSATKNERGVNYCVNAGFVCHACTQPGFPDAYMPFWKLR